jgi:hypothetical protein
MRPIEKIADALASMAQSKREQALISGMVRAPLQSDLNKLRGDVWLQAYCAALNCSGITHTEAAKCGDNAVNAYMTRFLNS